MSKERREYQMLTDSQLETLADKMNFKLAGVFFKDAIPRKIQFNKAYMINLDDKFDLSGNLSSGSHWVCFQVNKHKDEKTESIYFDPYGQPPPENLKQLVKDATGKQLPYSTKDIQSLMNNACGWYCTAFLHFINASPYRSGNLYSDVSTFLDMFDDLNESVDFKKNEYILKHFFLSADPKKRKQVDVMLDANAIYKDDVGNTPDISKI